MRKLIKAEKENEIWYFTTQAKAAQFIGCTQTQIRMALTKFMKRAKGWVLDYIEDDFVMSKFIDPERPYSGEELVLTKQMFELLRQVIENDKRINELEKRIEELKN